MEAQIWDILTKVSIGLPILTLVFSGVLIYWKQHKKIKDLKVEVSDLLNKEVKKNGNLLFESVLPNVEAVKGKIIEIINLNSENNSQLRIDNFGLDLETVSSMFKYTLQDQSKSRDIVYRGLIIDPESSVIKSSCGGGSNLCQETAQAAIQTLNKINEATEYSLSIDLNSYDALPVMHGFLIDDEHLIMGFTHFSNGGLVGGSSPYIYVKRDRSSPFKESLFVTYKSWFDYWLKHGTKKVPQSNVEQLNAKEKVSA
ncbi:MAG: hypothetical protein OCD00_09510 [Colwellia sp.]